jgi:hypothetical protein
MKKYEAQHKQFSGGKRKKAHARLPELETMFDFDGDPLEGVEYDPNDLEASAERELSEIARLIKEQKRAVLDRFRVANDPDYWVALCFQCHEQRDEFLVNAGWADLGDKYLNGLEVARRLGVPVKIYDVSPLPLRGKPKKFTREEVI